MNFFQCTYVRVYTIIVGIHVSMELVPKYVFNFDLSYMQRFTVFREISYRILKSYFMFGNV